MLVFLAGLNNLLLAYEDKSAYAMCIFSFALDADSEPITFTGRTHVSDRTREKTPPCECDTPAIFGRFKRRMELVV
jgi:hypothetical protein